MRNYFRLIVVCCVCAAGGLLVSCDLVGFVSLPTPTPTRALSAPTLQASPTIAVLPVQDLDDDFSVGRNDLTAASLPSGGALPPLVVTGQPGSLAQRVQLLSAGGQLVYGDLYSVGVNRRPGVLLLGVDTTIWGNFPSRLLDEGFTVLALSVPANTDDFNAALQSFSEAGTVNPGYMGVVGAESGADMALIGCATNFLCDAAVLLTPTAGDTLLNVIAGFSPRALLVSASQTDPDSLQTVQALARLSRGEVLVQPFENAGRGAAMLQNRPDFLELIIGWLKGHLPA